MHVIQIIANSPSVPYFIWFAQENLKYSHIKITFVAMCKTEPQMNLELEKLGYDCYWIPFDSQKRITSWFFTFFKLIKMFRKIKPDIVHSHLFDDAVPALLAAKILNVKARFITKQDTAYHWFYAPKAVIFDRINNLLATHIIAVSEECKEFILKYEKANYKKLYMIHHGIKDETLLIDSGFKKMLIEKYDLKDKFIVGTIARLIDWKGHELVVEVARKVIERYPNVVFLFVGEGPLFQKIKNAISEKGLEKNVILTGFVDRKYIPSLYSTMDVYLHAAKFEPFGFVIAEAMYSKVPVLSTKTGAAKDAIVHEKNGYIVDYDNVEHFVAGIEFYLNQDRKHIGLKGMETAKRMYNVKKMWLEYQSLYKIALSNN